MRIRLVALLVALALLALGCGRSQPALRVGDATVERSEMLDELAARGSLVDGQAPMSSAGDYLTEQALFLSFNRALEAAGLEVRVASDADLPDAFSQLRSAVAESADFDEVDVGGIVQCSRHILVATEAEADDVLATVVGGGDFAALAAEVSTDTASGAQGGNLGCTGSGSLVPEFEAALVAADIGEVIGPVETEFGFHVIERLDVPPDVRAQAAPDVLGLEALRLDEVEVDPRYGTWDPDQFAVLPPAPGG